MSKPFAAAMTNAVVALLLFAVCQPVGAITVMESNAEWFWDGELPHEGRVAIGLAGSPPSRYQVKLDAYAITLRTREQNPDIVALSEVENEDVVGLVGDWLGSDWSVVWKKDRDHITGQDVAILTCLSVQHESVSILKNTKKGIPLNGMARARPSKVLVVFLRDGDTRHLVIVLHFVSKRGNNDDKRVAQVNSVRNHLRTAAPEADPIILLGDLNDKPDSGTLAVLQGDHDDGVKLFQSSGRCLPAQHRRFPLWRDFCAAVTASPASISEIGKRPEMGFRVSLSYAPSRTGMTDERR